MIIRPKAFVLCLASLLLGTAFAAGKESATTLPELVSTTGGGNQWSNLAELQKAATAGNPKACVALGEMYVNGDQVAKDVPHGIALLEQAAKKGNADAAFRLGKIYDDGEVATQDYPKALEYYKTAALAGVSTAQYNIGVIYAGAHGVKRDFKEGLAWLIVATKNGASGDGEKQVRDRLTQTKHPEIIAAAEQRATEIAGQIHAPEPAPTPPNSANGQPATSKSGRKKE